MPRVAIVGAGVSGLAAAWQLARESVETVVFEASAHLGGRVSTVERGPNRFDDGAQFIRTDTPAAEQLLLQKLPPEELVDIRREVRPFDRHGAVGPGDPTQNALPKWVYRSGLRTLAHLLAAGTGGRVHLNWAVSALSVEDGNWRVSGPRGDATGFDAVIVTLPPRAALWVIERSGLGTESQGAAAALSACSYRALISVAFEPIKPVEPPQDAYALVNSDRKHAVSWLAFEEAKQGYVPEGRQLVVAQMAHAWSIEALADPDREIANDAARAVSGLLNTRLVSRWAHVTRWPEALPDAHLDLAPFAPLEAAGLFFAGDAFVGGRVHLALESGLAAAERVASRLGIPASVQP